MKEPILVPVRVDALCIAEENFAREDLHPYAKRSIEFLQLPFESASGKFRLRAANLADNFRAKPFETDVSQRFHRWGIHLHWALPDALTRGKAEGNRVVFPVVPNRWLVVRIFPNRPPKGWVVESDFLCVNAKPDTNPVTVPTPKAEDRPFRYMGRVVPLELWKDGYEDPSDKFQSSEVFPRLTAVGHGEAQFAAYYPDCNSVFGFRDHFSDLDDTYDEAKPGPDSRKGFRASACPNLSYCVVGWYSKTANDPLLSDRSLDELKWKLSSSAEPAGTLLHGLVAGIDWDPEKKGGYRQEPSERPNFAIGNTAAEALSALLASKGGSSTLPLNEELFNALQLGIAGDLDSRESSSAVRGALHRSAFGAEPGGTIWSIVPAEASPRSQFWGEAGTPAATNPLFLFSRSLGERLDALNRLQMGCDALGFRLASFRWQTFSDWYKYLTVRYEKPAAGGRSGFDLFCRRIGGDANLLTADLETRLTQGAGLLAELNQEKAAIAAEVERLKAFLSEEIGRLNAARANERQAPLPQLRLKPLAAPTFQQPSEPVVLLEGELVRPSVRYGQDGAFRSDGFLDVRTLSQVERAVPARLVSLPDFFKPDSELARVIQALVAESAELAGDKQALSKHPLSPVAVNRWNGLPWNPLLLEWATEYFPVKTIRSGDPRRPDANNRYDPQFLEANGFSFGEGRVDLRHDGPVASEGQAYKGRCILSSRAVQTLKFHAEQFLSALPEKERLEILQGLQNRPVLSQSLGGFNAALIQREQQTQFEIRDPLIDRTLIPGADPASYLDEDLQAFIAGENTAAPLPYSNYNPIRAGYLTLRRLRIVDSFGQFFPLELEDLSGLAAAAALSNPAHKGRIYLPPRIVQPSRLLLRWVSSERDGLEANDHPLTSPVCGWVLVNHLDRSIMLFEASGHALGALVQPHRDAPPRWQEALGREAAPLNPHLQDFIDAVLQGEAGFFSHLIETIEAGTAQIGIPDFRAGQSLAFLLGRPLALVRASLSLELKGDPAYDQAWSAYGNPGARTFETRAFDEVQFPVVLGDLRDLQDGLVGFFRDQEKNFYTSAVAGRPVHPQIVRQDERPVRLSLGDNKPVFLTLLMEPHARVHASLGLLPAKAIELLPQHYTPALQAMEPTFRTAPVLRRRDAAPALPLPGESGFVWNWLEWIAGPSGGRVSTVEVDEPQPGSVPEEGPLELSDGYLKLRIQTNHESAPPPP